MKIHKKQRIKEKEIQQDDESLNFERCELIRVYAVDFSFENVSFKQSIINECYFRNCQFKNCDFTGAKISDTNFQGAEFLGCNFMYTSFDRTQIGMGPLKRNLPIQDNLKMYLAKSLRMNYASIGDYEGVNFAIKVELEATWSHLFKAAFSREQYYRDKSEYNGFWNRSWYVIKCLNFGLFRLIWGNGEIPSLMFLSIPCLVFVMSLLIFLSSDISFHDSIRETFSVFCVGGKSAKLSLLSSSVINIARYIAMGLFVSSLVRRLSRR
ncbi:pentapeptide repeat-containing protein [Gimesia benthica]|uniref:Pentapeptide repeat-containing protein n=1 Tax=Gimesia benthica TaxID=2608982 RepID=A0A6I6A4W4_9PLAN|nr:pentapeptide repeat-containing protein [Gimesia benthica]QGQ21447.1 pentapeptide repeat-containing protein [Gimesia benthica]